MNKGKLEIPLDNGTLEIEFKFIPKEKEKPKQLSFLSGSESQGKEASFTPAMKGQKSLLIALSKRFRRNVDVEALSKREASHLIQEMLVEIKNSMPM